MRKLFLQKPGFLYGFVMDMLQSPPEPLFYLGMPLPRPPCGWVSYSFSAFREYLGEMKNRGILRDIPLAHLLLKVQSRVAAQGTLPVER